MKESVVLFIAVRCEVQRPGDTDQLFFFYLLFVLFHERLIGPPRDTSRLDRVTLRPNRNLMGMKIVEPQFVKERLFDNLVREQKRFDPDRFQQPANGSRKMTVDKNGFAIDAVSGNVGDIIIVADRADPPMREGRQPRSGYSSEP